MIIYELVCRKNHRFEGWFASAEDFSSQQRCGLLACPTCADKSIEKLLIAKIGRPVAEPALTPAADDGSRAGAPVPAQNASPAKLNELIDYILAHTENVGTEFATEARRIHNKQATQRDIRGTASREEAEELLEEGISVMPLPIPPQSEWH
jgi:hypothetical protein